jgi:hypothetical protein
MPPGLTEQHNLFDYFHDRVRQALAAGGTQLSDDAVLYLAQLLAERSRTDRQAPQADTLAELHALAIASPPAHQVRAWRELGDRSLHGLGQFREHYERRIVSVSYYQSMGRAAYHRVDGVVKRWFADCFGALFAELSARFDDCVDVLARIRAVHDRDHVDEVYQTWLQTGSPEAREWLERRGLILLRKPGSA